MSLGFQTVQPKRSAQGWRMRLAVRVTRMGEQTSRINYWPEDLNEKKRERSLGIWRRITKWMSREYPVKMYDYTGFTRTRMAVSCKSFYVRGTEFLDQSRICWSLKHPDTWTYLSTLINSHNWGKQIRVSHITCASTIRYSEHRALMTYELIVKIF